MNWFLALALAATSQAALRFGCATLSIQRLDPLVEPGRLPSAHVHQIVGGNVCNATISGDIGAQDGVPLMQNTALPDGINGGMTIYYTQQDFNSNGNQKITAFKPGFRMTVGSPTTSTLDAAKGHAGLCFVCLDNKGTRFPELPDFLTKACKGGIMTVQHFPSCWDGKNLDSPDHQSHMYSTTKEAFTPAGPCPGAPPPTPSFNNMWPKDGSNPFFLSFGDNKGYGTHADYVFGWKGDSLQRAMDSSCMFQACENGKPLKSQSVAEMNKCSVQKFVSENIDGWIPQLPVKQTTS